MNQRTKVLLAGVVTAAHRAARTSLAWTKRVALLLLGVAVAPWVWYFVLRRAAELGAAISGKPPT
jgi:hypothetical protein